MNSVNSVNITKISNATSSLESRSSEIVRENQAAYNEMSDSSAYRADVLVQLKANISELEDLHSRLRFMMGEITYLMKKSSF